MSVAIDTLRGCPARRRRVPAASCGRSFASPASRHSATADATHRRRKGGGMARRSDSKRFRNEPFTRPGNCGRYDVTGRVNGASRVSHDRAAPHGFGRIAAVNVTFSYPGEGDPALHEVSMEIGRGEVIALVGENGSARPRSPRSSPACTSPIPVPCSGTRPRSPTSIPSSCGTRSR